MGNSNATATPFVILLNYHGEKTRKEFPVFLKGNILLESDTATNLNDILK